MKIAWVMTDFDPSNPNKHPFGIGWFIVDYLRKAGHTVDVLGGFSNPISLIYKAKKLFYKLISSKTYLLHREPAIHQAFAKRLNGELATSKYDFILSFGSLPIALIDTDIPIFFWADATFEGLVNYYPEYSNISEHSHKKGHYLEQMALDNCELAFFSSEWAVDTAKKYYNVYESKLFFIPYGANFIEYKDINVVQLINDKSFDTINFLFNGRDWQRKNGDSVIEVVRLLNSKGLKARLNIIGIDNIPNIDDDFVVFHGFINKADEAGRRKMLEIYMENHFLIHIPHQDCTPHALNEANAYGLPCIVSDTGGISSVVKQNVNGLIFSVPLNLELIADEILKIANNKVQYKELAKSSYKEYKNNLNWEVNIKRLLEVIENKINKN